MSKTENTPLISRDGVDEKDGFGDDRSVSTTGEEIHHILTLKVNQNKPIYAESWT